MSGWSRALFWRLPLSPKKHWTGRNKPIQHNRTKRHQNATNHIAPGPHLHDPQRPPARGDLVAPAPADAGRRARADLGAARDQFDREPLAAAAAGLGAADLPLPAGQPVRRGGSEGRAPVHPRLLGAGAAHGWLAGVAGWLVGVVGVVGVAGVVEVVEVVCTQRTALSRQHTSLPHPPRHQHPRHIVFLLHHTHTHTIHCRTPPPSHTHTRHALSRAASSRRAATTRRCGSSSAATGGATRAPPSPTSASTSWGRPSRPSRCRVSARARARAQGGGRLVVLPLLPL